MYVSRTTVRRKDSQTKEIPLVDAHTYVEVKCWGKGAKRQEQKAERD
jgi:hypothetical protein